MTILLWKFVKVYAGNILAVLLKKTIDPWRLSFGTENSVIQDIFMSYLII